MVSHFSRIAVILAAAHATCAFAQSAPDVADLVGARGAGGETQLEARGYALVTTNKVRDTSYTIWWNARSNRCISVATSDGRYAAINAIPAANCASTGANGATAGREGSAHPAAVHSGSGLDLTLVCYGSGTALQARSYSGYGYNSDRDRFEPTSGTSVAREGFSSDVQFEFADGEGRVHLVGQLVSPIHSGGIDGWWPIRDLVITPDRITGSYRMNGLNKPSFEIDRRSGTVRIKATTNFTGRCDQGNWRSGF